MLLCISIVNQAVAMSNPPTIEKSIVAYTTDGLCHDKEGFELVLILWG